MRTGKSACATKSEFYSMREGKARGWKRRAGKRALPRSSIALHPALRDDSGPVLTKAPQLPRRDCRRQLRRKIVLHLSLRPPKFLGIRPGYSLLPHLYQDIQKITSGTQRVNFCIWCVRPTFSKNKRSGRSPTFRPDSRGDSVNRLVSSEALYCSQRLKALKHFLDGFRLIDGHI